MRLGPILRYELTRAARRPGLYVLRAFLGVFMILAFYILREGYATSENWLARFKDPRSLPWLADMLFLQLTLFQALAVLVLVPGLVAASIAEEDRRGTMLDLLATPLTSGAIVLQKLAARLVHLGALLAAVLPPIALLGLLGAIHSALVVRAEAMLCTLTLFVASLSLLVSSVVRRPRWATVAAYLLVGGWLVLGFSLGPVARTSPWPISWLGALNDAFLLTHPALPAMYLCAIPDAMLFDDPSVATWAWSALGRTFPWVVGLQAACSALFVALAVLALRPVRLGWRRRGVGSSRRAAREPVVWSRPPVGDDPMLWKERYAAGRSLGPAARIAVVLIGALLLFPLFGPARDAFQEWWASWRGDTHFDHRRFALNQSLRNLHAGLSLLGFAAVAAVGATGVTGERERRTWTSLATTPVTGREVARAKVAGALRALRMPAIVFPILWGVGLATGAVHPLGVVAAAVGLLVFARYAAATGVLVSMVSRSSERAMVGTFLALITVPIVALLFVPLNLIGPLATTRHALPLASVIPFVEWIALMSPIEIGNAFGRWPSEGQIRLPWHLWYASIRLVPELVRIYALGLALHALAASAAVWAAARAYERE